ncbi:hypothetical protein Pa4123_15960 [Phytohabitans aurantiacus]|uniref:Uncharacterized protein n=1 Tax=Phytohabitans aurantiacus TaxID=3016789 RepID=A0ABQ5QQT7_9ACTN|nr:hypothetical protein Pa4123_15960 [Phytohabitans aurantiacus]
MSAPTRAEATLLSTRDTVVTDTPAASATVRIFTFGFFIPHLPNPFTTVSEHTLSLIKRFVNDANRPLHDRNI